MNSTTPAQAGAHASTAEAPSPQKKTTTRKRFTMIPNMVLEAGLSPQSFRVFAEIRRVAGDKGECYLSTKSLSERCRMATGSISAAKKELLKLGFIIKAHGQTGHLSQTFRIPSDIWDRNKKHFEAAAKAKRSIRESQRSPIERPRSHGETIKNRKENPEEKPSTHQAAKDSMEIRGWKNKFLNDGADESQAEILALFNQMLTPMGYLPVCELSPEVLRTLETNEQGSLEDLQAARELFTTAAQSSPPDPGEKTFVRCVNNFRQ
jgi:hypothetical protein